MAPSSALEAYVANLPQGLHSYLAQQTKASAIRSKLKMCPALADHAGLPPPLRRWLTETPLSSEWVPSARAFALNMAICDVVGGEEGSLAFIANQNRELMTSPLYRAASFALSPETVIKHAPSRFAHFHPGFGLSVEIKCGEAAVQLAAPAHLVNRLMARAITVPLQIGLELAGLTNPDVALTTWEPTVAVYRVTL